MRIVQLIDSLEAGGAERMAVHYANALSEKIAFSGLVATRKEGVLKQDIQPIVSYAFLGRKNKFDFKAIGLMLDYIKKNQIEIVHAHGSSYFFGVLVKIFCPKIKLIWHDHYGNRAKDHKQKMVLKICSFFFSKILTVNDELRIWALRYLNCKHVFFIPKASLARPGGHAGVQVGAIFGCKGNPHNYIGYFVSASALGLNLNSNE